MNVDAASLGLSHALALTASHRQAVTAVVDVAVFLVTPGADNSAERNAVSYLFIGVVKL